MRNPKVMWLAAALVALVAAACGASSKEVSAAKTAHYKGDKLAIFNAAKTTTEAKYHLQKSDETTLGLQTVPKWFTPEGLSAGERGGDVRDLPDKSVQIALVVRVLPDGDAWVIDVKPLLLRYHAGSPKPEPLKPEDPSVPGWATGKVDELSLDIHKALAQYEVKSVPAAPGSAPPAAAPAPAAPAADPAAAGSATPAT
jgi:hypothetical protein